MATLRTQVVGFCETVSSWELVDPIVADPNAQDCDKINYVCIYIYAVKSVIGPSLGVFKVNDWAKSKSIIGQRSFSHYKNRGSKRFLFAQLSLCVFCSQLLANFLK